MSDKIKCYLCSDHFERIPGNPCSSCPSIKEHEDVVKILSRQDLEDTPMNRIMLSEVRSIRIVLEGFSKQIEELDHAVHGNGAPGMKTELAVLKETVSENKGRPAMVFSIATSAVAVIASIVAILK